MGTTAFKCVLGGAAVGIVGISGTVGVLFGAGWGTLAFAAQVTAVYCGVVVLSTHTHHTNQQSTQQQHADTGSCATANR